MLTGTKPVTYKDLEVTQCESYLSHPVVGGEEVEWGREPLPLWEA